MRQSLQFSDSVLPATKQAGSEGLEVRESMEAALAAPWPVGRK